MADEIPWTPWEGGFNPVAEDTWVQVKFKPGSIGGGMFSEPSRAFLVQWHHVAAYRVTPAPPHAVVTPGIDGAPSPWQPEAGAVRLAVLGKLAEELGELSAIVARCIIQGIDESEPRTGVLNRDALAKEMADVSANIAICRDHFKIDPLLQRQVGKMAFLDEWHELLR